VTLEHTLVRHLPPREREAPVEAVDSTELATVGLFAQMLDPAAAAAERRRIRHRIIELNLPFATRLAHRFCRRGQYTEDLEQVAALALVKAVDGFDLGRGKPFFGYLVPTVMGELKRHFRDKGWDVHVSRRLQERHLELTRTRAALLQQLQRPPTVAELAAALDLTEKEVADVLTAGSAYDADSLNAKATSDEDSCERQDLVGADDPAIASACDRLVVQDLLRRLPEREQFILNQYFFGNATQEQIAGGLGMSQMNVSRVLRRTLQRLRQKLEGDDGPETDSDVATNPVTVYPAGPHTMVLAVRGTLDAAGVAKVRAALIDTAVRGRPRRVVVDLRHADGSAAGIAQVLVDGYRACGHSGSSLVTVNVSEPLYKVLSRLGVTRLFPCRPLVTAAGTTDAGAQAARENPTKRDESTCAVDIGTRGRSHETADPGRRHVASTVTPAARHAPSARRPVPVAAGLEPDRRGPMPTGEAPLHTARGCAPGPRWLVWQIAVGDVGMEGGATVRRRPSVFSAVRRRLPRRLGAAPVPLTCERAARRGGGTPGRGEGPPPRPSLGPPPYGALRTRLPGAGGRRARAP
jgi:RNA polymerase sigma-70 factor (sigma-B/F/G subfamily)